MSEFKSFELKSLVGVGSRVLSVGKMGWEAVVTVRREDLPFPSTCVTSVNGEKQEI